MWSYLPRTLIRSATLLQIEVEIAHWSHHHHSAPRTAKPARIANSKDQTRRLSSNQRKVLMITTQGLMKAEEAFLESTTSEVRPLSMISISSRSWVQEPTQACMLSRERPTTSPTLSRKSGSTTSVKRKDQMPSMRYASSQASTTRM